MYRFSMGPTSILWNGDLDAISTEDWDLETFIRERLDDWLELFGHMELVGDDEA